MNGKEIFDVWSSPGAWSYWTKPPLFVHLDGDLGPVVESVRLDATWAPSAVDGVILVIDLPGRAAIDFGVTLAQHRGFRPVPLHNVCSDPNEAIDQRPVLQALHDGAQALSRLEIALDAAPAFLLDSRRMNNERPLIRGRLDNRWRVHADDFPSSQILLSKGLTRAVVVQARNAPLDDLAEVLANWQHAGLVIEWKDPLAGGSGQLMAVQASWLRRAALWTLGIQKNPRGSFGVKVPSHS